MDPTRVFAEGKGGVSERHGRRVVRSVDDHLGHHHVSQAGVVGGVRQHQLELLGQLVLAVVDELHVAGGHADAGAEDHAVVIGRAAALVVRAGLQSVEAAPASRPGHSATEGRHGAGGVACNESIKLVLFSFRGNEGRLDIVHGPLLALPLP